MDNSSDGAQHAAGLAHGFRTAMKARKGMVLKQPATEAQKACADAVRDALEAAVVQALFSDAPEAYFDGLLLAQRSLAAEQRRPRDRGSRR